MQLNILDRVRVRRNQGTACGCRAGCCLTRPVTWSRSRPTAI